MRRADFNDSVLSILFNYLRTCFAAAPKLLFIAIISRLILAIGPVVQLYIAKLIIDVVVEIIKRGEGLGISIFSSSQLVNLIMVEIVLGVLILLARRTNALAIGLLGEHLSIFMTNKLILGAGLLTQSEHESRQIQDQYQRARNVAADRGNLFDILMSNFETTIFAISASVALITYDTVLFLTIACATLPVAVSERYFNRRTFSLFQNQSARRREIEHLLRISIEPRSSLELIFRNLFGWVASKQKEIANSIKLETQRLAVLRNVVSFLILLLGLIAYYFCFVMVVSKTISEELTVGDLTFVSAILLQVQMVLHRLLIGYAQMSSRTLYLRDYFTFAATSHDHGSFNKPKMSLPTSPQKKAIEFADVSFSYSSNINAIHELSFHIEYGEKVAITGPNGSGKSTVLKLMAGTIEPTHGNIFVNGKPSSALGTKGISDFVEYLPQDPIRFEATIAENVALADQSDDSSTRITSALELVGLKTKVDDLPFGQMTRVGQLFDGNELSGGEWQRLLLARAVYHANQKILLLDEPTGAMVASDAVSFINSLLKRNGTLVVITHDEKIASLFPRRIMINNNDKDRNNV